MSRLGHMTPKQEPQPRYSPPTPGQTKAAFWLSVIAAIGIWCIFVFVLVNRGLGPSLLALPLPILATYSAISLLARMRHGSKSSMLSSGSFEARTYLAELTT